MSGAISGKQGDEKVQKITEKRRQYEDKVVAKEARREEKAKKDECKEQKRRAEDSDLDEQRSHAKKEEARGQILRKRESREASQTRI